PQAVADVERADLTERMLHPGEDALPGLGTDLDEHEPVWRGAMIREEPDCRRHDQLAKNRTRGARREEVRSRPVAHARVVAAVVPDLRVVKGEFHEALEGHPAFRCSGPENLQKLRCDGWTRR